VTRCCSSIIADCVTAGTLYCQLKANNCSAVAETELSVEVLDGSGRVIIIISVLQHIHSAARS